MWMPEYLPYRAASPTSSVELVEAAHDVMPSV